MADRNYPLPQGDEDPRFTIGLTSDVTAVIEAAGYPKLTPADQYELMGDLFRFLYVGAEVEK